MAGGTPAVATSISQARAAVGAHTHHGADSIEDLRLTGRCSGAAARIVVGHAAPFEPLHRTGGASIDRTRPPRHAGLRVRCDHGSFALHRPLLEVRWGAGPLRAWPAGDPGAAVEVALASIAIE